MHNIDTPDFDFPDMVWGFLFAATLSGGNVSGAIALAAGFVAQKQVRRDRTLLPRAGRFLIAAIPGLDDTTRRLRLPWGRTALPAPAGQAATLAAPVAGNADAAADPGGDLLTLLADPPHRLIIGHTRGGKTTLIHHLATTWAAQGEQVVVADPDAAPGLWPGCTVAGAGDDLDAIAGMFRTVAAEVSRRRTLRAQGVRRFPPLHLVIDEAQDVLPGIAGGLALFEDIARRGGKLNMRLTIGVQDKQVKTLGLEGKSEVLRNLLVVDVLKARDGRRVAHLRDPETNARVALAIPPLSDPEALIRPRTADDRRPATDDRLPTTDDRSPFPEQFAGANAFAPASAAPAHAIIRAPDHHVPAAVQPRAPAASHPVPDDLLSALMAEVPPSVRSTHHPVDPPGIRTNIATDTVNTGIGGIELNVTTVVERARRAVGRRRGSGRAPDMRGRRERLNRYAQVKALVQEGRSANDIVRIVRRNRNDVIAEVQRARQELGLGPRRPTASP